MTNLKNKTLVSALIALVCIRGQVQAQRVSISKIDVEEVHLAATVIGLSEIFKLRALARSNAYFFGKNYAAATSAQDHHITTTYDDAIRHDFTINASFEMLLAGCIAKQDISINNEHIRTTIQLAVLKSYYSRMLFQQYNSFHDEVRQMYNHDSIENIERIRLELFIANKISFELNREITHLLFSELLSHRPGGDTGPFMSYDMDTNFSILGLCFRSPGYIGPDKLCFNTNKILKQLIKDAETALVICGGIYAERLESVRRVVKKRNAKWQKRIFELQKAALLSVTTLDKITFSE